MKKLACSATAAVLAVFMSTSVMAADVDMSAPSEAAPDWTGFYVGLQGGGVAHESEFTCDGPCLDGPYDSGLTQLLAGGYAGYNFQFDRMLFGIEGDINALFGSSSFSNDEWDAISDGYKISSDYYASIRARLGFMPTEKSLLFVTGGWAFTEYTLNNPGCSDCSAWGSLDLIEGRRDGYVAGGGAEYALDPNVHFKIEYLFSDFGSQENYYDDECCGDASFDSDLTTHQIRFGMSWNFMN